MSNPIITIVEIESNPRLQRAVDHIRQANNLLVIIPMYGPSLPQQAKVVKAAHDILRNGMSAREPIFKLLEPTPELGLKGATHHLLDAYEIFTDAGYGKAADRIKELVNELLGEKLGEQTMLTKEQQMGDVSLRKQRRAAEGNRVQEYENEGKERVAMLARKWAEFDKMDEPVYLQSHAEDDDDEEEEGL
ncbi:Hypothetical predicted protein [Lecanosticta acicola]|uniref:Uncharacterized protein n=1 Tax=Lecanosticta acicola TaxID=111012 RepID=A0AAI8Z8Y0_9PEZI|nr:Hypothetical predicted protein [Lecanosticta acicola]